MTESWSDRSNCARAGTVLLCLLAASVLVSPLPAGAEFKRTKIAVLDFQVQGSQSENADLGKIVAEWFITALVQEGRFDVIERRLLDKVLDEQKIGISGIVDEGSASKIGKVLGAKIVITGTILEFQKIVEVNARIVDVESSSIIAAENVKSTAGAEKLEDLVVKMTKKIIEDFPLEGYVAQRDGMSLVLDLGQQAGIKRGMRFVAYKEGSVIKHPKTGEILDIVAIETGELEIVDVRQKISTATVVKEEAPGAITKGMMVKQTAGSGYSLGEARARELEQIRRQEELRRQDELRTQEELRRQEELGKKEDLKRQEQLKREEELRKKEELKKQEQLRREEELRKKEELRKQERLKREEELRKKEELKKQERLKREEELRMQENATDPPEPEPPPDKPERKVNVPAPMF